MKTTIEISDALFLDTKRYAEKHKLTFREVVETSLRHHLEAQPTRKFRLKKKTFRAKALVDLHDWSSLRKTIYQGRSE